jgi:hypothetical protein
MAENKFTKIPKSTFDELQIEAGVLLKDFDPATGTYNDEDLITATSGGIQIDVKSEITDFGDDVDNVPKNTMELAHVDDVTATLKTTALCINEQSLIRYLGPAYKDETTGAIKLRKYLDLNTDFEDLWFVGDIAGGGMIAAKMSNALSTDGLSLKTEKKGKGKIGVTFTSFYSIDDMDNVPVEFYVKTGKGKTGIKLNKHSATVEIGSTLTLEATTNPAEATVTWESNDTSVATVSNGVITPISAGYTLVIAKITEDGKTYTDTCVVQVTGGEG